ncbi:MAG: pseudouridine synthase [Eubacterium sp.]
MERIDKIISKAKNISRSEAAAFVKKGLVAVDGKTVKSPAQKAEPSQSEIFFCGERIIYSEFVYIMMNKPKGVISASEGKNEKTVIDILPQELRRKRLFPAGRLDKDTTGFMLITDDGAFAHRILSPKNHIPKTYIATVDKPVTEQVIRAFEQGVSLKDEKCLPAKIQKENADFTVARVTVHQGMYHQIKRMFAAFGITVTELERVKMGGLELDYSLERGQCRLLSSEEIQLIENGE